MKINLRINNEPANEGGQTLIETVIAIFILVSGIAAAVGLAIFAFSSSQNIIKQTIAVGLAREGIEGIKNMRDTNWLKQSTIDINCYNPQTGLNDASCYLSWQTQAAYPTVAGWPEGQDLDPPSNPADFALGMYYDDSPTSLYTEKNYWLLYLRPGVCSSFSLDFDADATNLNVPYGSGFYRPRCDGAGNSGFYRQIELRKDDGVAQYGSGANNPFNKNTGPRLSVISRVWWTDKNCPASVGWPGLGKCSVELTTYLTNWKNY